MAVAVEGRARVSAAAGDSSAGREARKAESIELRVMVTGYSRRMLPATTEFSERLGANVIVSMS